MQPANRKFHACTYECLTHNDLVPVGMLYRHVVIANLHPRCFCSAFKAMAPRKSMIDDNAMTTPIEGACMHACKFISLASNISLHESKETF